MMHRSARRLSLAAAIVSTTLLATASSAFAQYRIDNGQVRDANNRIGSGGYNTGGGNNSTGGLNNNLIVTGNVGGGRSFRGNLGYTDSSAFRGNLGSASFDRFTRDSVGIGQVRGSDRLIYANQGVTTFRPFFGQGQTVAPPAGFVQDSATGGYVLPRPQLVTPNDGRLDYGGATRSQISRGTLAQSTIIGGPGLSNSSFGAFDQRRQLDQPFGGSEFTQLARPAARIGLLEQNQSGRAGSLDGRVVSNPRNPSNPANDGPAVVDRKTNDAAADDDPRTALNGAAGSGGAPGDPTRASQATTPAGTPITPAITPAITPTTPAGTAPPANNATPAIPTNATSTGQGVQTRDLRAIQNNPQYAALQGRLNARKSAGPGQAAIEESNRRNQAVLAQRAKGTPATPADAKGTADVKGSADASGTADAKLPTNARPSPSALPGATPQLATPDAVAPQQAELRPAGTPGAAASVVTGADQGPLEIKSLATGVKDAELRNTLADAEQMMRAGKFTSAIDAYDRAESIASDDPLVFTGRGIAELGGGYYRDAERHFRQAFAADHSLLLAKFDLRQMLSAERLNFLLDDIGRTANANKSDPGPLMLLAIVYYNTNLPDRAAKALDLAQQRAGGRDPVVKLMSEHWTLPSKSDAGDLNK